MSELLLSTTSLGWANYIVIKPGYLYRLNLSNIEELDEYLFVRDEGRIIYVDLRRLCAQTSSCRNVEEVIVDQQQKDMVSKFINTDGSIIVIYPQYTNIQSVITLQQKLVDMNFFAGGDVKRLEQITTSHRSIYIVDLDTESG